MQYWRGYGYSTMALPKFKFGQGVQKLTLVVIRTAVFILTLVLATVSHAQSSQAEKNPWQGRQYGHFAHDEPLRDLLYDFASSVSVPTIVSPNISATVNGHFPAVSADEYLARIAKTYELAWVYDGTTLYIYNISEIERKTLDLPYPLAEKFRSQLKSLALKGEPLSWNLLPAQNTIQVSGPPRFVELISETVAWVLKQQAGEVGDESYTVRVFYIKYGYVDEAMNNISGNGAKVTSLAERLAQIMNVSHITKVANNNNPSRKLLGTGLVPDEQPPQSSTASSTAAQGRKSEAYIASDSRLNAIIVRDLESRMPTYDQLIRQLDVPQDQIQIQVTILDIRDTDAQSLGLNWSGDSGNIQRGDVNFSLNLAMNATVVGGIIAEIAALEESGRSRVVSRPSVLTLDNHEALFQSNQTFYVRLGAERSDAVDLVPVSYGSVLRVRPHLIYEPEERKIYLSVHVEDGTRGSGAAVTEVPEVSRTVIQTQAIIGERQSLLIGGYSIRERLERKRRVPLFGYIPLLGRLFTWKHENEMNFDRYFVITPTIIDTSIAYKLHTGFDDIDSGYNELLQDKGHSTEKEKTEKEKTKKKETEKEKTEKAANQKKPISKEESGNGNKTRQATMLAEPSKKTVADVVVTQPAPRRQQHYIRTATGDALWTIAVKIRPSRQVTIQQTMIAILKANPSAFPGNNINRMKTGYKLRIPRLSEIQREDVRAAENQVHAHQQALGSDNQGKLLSDRKQ